MASAVKVLKEAIESNKEDDIVKAKCDLLKSAKDPIADWLDSKHGASVTDNAIFAELPRYWENEFHKDMKNLNVCIKQSVMYCMFEFD